MLKYKCQICGKEMSKEEAYNSSFIIRNLFPKDETTSKAHLWDVWVNDICNECVHRDIKVWDDFEKFIEEQERKKACCKQ